MHTRGHIYIEKGTVGISNNSVCLSNRFGYSDVMEMQHWANTPIVKANQDVIVIYDFKDIESCIIE